MFTLHRRRVWPWRLYECDRMDSRYVCESVRTLGEKFVQFNMADKTVAPSFGREQSMDKKFAGCKIEMTPLLIVP